MVILIAEGDSLTPSFASVFESYVEKIEGLLKQAENVTELVPQKLETILAFADTTSQTILNITGKADTAVHIVDSVSKDKIKQAKLALGKVADGSKQADQLMNDFESSPVGKLLENDSLIQKTNALIQSTQNLIKAFNTKGLDIRDENGNKVSLIRWENINLIGKTAREKAKLREQLKEN
jgi:hypothetical protein